MSTAIMKVEDVIKQCNAVIAAIDKRRKESDEKLLAEEIQSIVKSENGWFGRLINKLPWNKPMTEEEIRKQADANLRDDWRRWYPDELTSDKWREAARRLLTLAVKSHLDVMHIDDKVGAVLFHWNIED